MNARKSLRRGFLIAAGTLSVGVGVAGIFLPLLPATPFFLVAAACYVRSSNRLYRWLLTNRVTGRYIANYWAGNGIPARAKAVSICVLWITLVISALMVQIWWVWLILGAVAVGVPLFILSLPTLEEEAVRRL
ncbi:MAG: YbaN family protein [Thermoanaerobaculia bacterium]